MKCMHHCSCETAVHYCDDNELGINSDVKNYASAAQKKEVDILSNRLQRERETEMERKDFFRR